MTEPSPSTLLQVLEGLQENMNSMQENMKSMQGSMISMQENMEKGMSDLKGEVKGLSSRIDGLDTRIGKLEGEVKTLRQESSAARGVASERHIRHHLEKQYGRNFAQRFVIHGLTGIAHLVDPENISVNATDVDEESSVVPSHRIQLYNAETLAKWVLEDKHLQETLKRFLRQLLPGPMPEIGDLDLKRDVTAGDDLKTWVSILKKANRRVFDELKVDANAKTDDDGSRATANDTDSKSKGDVEAKATTDVKSSKSTVDVEEETKKTVEDSGSEVDVGAKTKTVVKSSKSKMDVGARTSMMVGDSESKNADIEEKAKVSGEKLEDKPDHPEFAAKSTEEESEVSKAKVKAGDSNTGTGPKWILTDNHGKKIQWFLGQVKRLIECDSLREKLDLMISDEGIGLALLMLCKYDPPKETLRFDKDHVQEYASCIVRTIEMDVRGMRSKCIDGYGNSVMMFVLGEIKSSWRERPTATAQLDKQATALQLAAEVLYDRKKKIDIQFTKILYVPQEACDSDFQQSGDVSVEFI